MKRVLSINLKQENLIKQDNVILSNPEKVRAKEIADCMKQIRLPINKEIAKNRLSNRILVLIALQTNGKMPNKGKVST